MKTDLTEIREFLSDCLKSQGDVFKATADNDTKLEICGTIPAMQGKKKVDGFYFASVIPKPKDVRLYFFPLYTHRDQIEPHMSAELKKALKGKTCFHIKSISDEMATEIEEMVKKSVKLYQDDGLLAK